MTEILTYMNTRQHLTNRWRGETFSNSIHLSDMELKRFNVSRVQLEAMPQVKTVGLNTYNIEGVNEIDISLLKPSGQPLTELHKWMLERVCETELPDNVESTDYWNTFLKHRLNYPELFFTVDAFSNRVHSPITGLSRDLRPFLMLRGEPTTEIDLATAQPTLLGNILFQHVGDNGFSAGIFEGKDIYCMLQAKANLRTRDEAKKRFFEIIFGKSNKDLSKLFEGANWIEWINAYKSTIDPKNPHSKAKPYSNLAHLLQTNEVKIFTEIWQKLGEAGIPFCSVHDSIIVCRKDQQTATEIMTNELNKHFKTFKLNSK